MLCGSKGLLTELCILIVPHRHHDAWHMPQISLAYAVDIAGICRRMSAASIFVLFLWLHHLVTILCQPCHYVCTRYLTALDSVKK